MNEDYILRLLKRADGGLKNDTIKETDAIEEIFRQDEEVSKLIDLVDEAENSEPWIYTSAK